MYTCFLSPFYRLPYVSVHALTKEHTDTLVDSVIMHRNAQASGGTISVAWECGTNSHISKRYVPLLFSEIVITDAIADSLLSGWNLYPPIPAIGGYDPEDTARARFSDTTVKNILLNEAQMMDDSLTPGTRYFWYLIDECNMANFACAARCNQILNRTGTAEMQGNGSTINRWITQVQPVTMISPGFGVGGGFDRAVFADTGMLNLLYDSLDYLKLYRHKIG